MIYIRLTSKEKQILTDLTVYFWTIKQIALRRQISISRVYQIKDQLVKKGCLKHVPKQLYKKPEPLYLRPPKKLPKIYWRLHGMEWHFKLIYSSPKYDKIKKPEIIMIDGNKIKLHKNTLRIFSHKLRWFEHENPTRARFLAMQYWTKFFYQLENKLNIILLKKGHQNFKLVNRHYAQVNNELAKEYNVKKEKITLYDKTDGKPYLKIDHSFNLDELELPHPKSADNDAIIYDKYFDDLRTNNPPTNSQLAAHLDNTIQLLSSNIKNTQIYAENIQKHLAVLEEISQTQKQQRETMKEISFSLNPVLLHNHILSQINSIEDIGSLEPFIEKLSPEAKKRLEKKIFRKLCQ